LKMPANFPEHALPPSRAFYWIEQQDRRQSCLSDVLAGRLGYQRCRRGGRYG
jgi:hypothetical protein